MPMCFVIQPFDDGEFDKRYSEEFEPALRDAGLEPYRVDKDPSVDVLIHEIERKIMDATICLADISTNNPNVWYELGYAFACNKSVIMVCSNERGGKFPFDIQHRNIIKYETGSRSDFDRLRTDISERAKALLKQQEREQTQEVEDAQREGIVSTLELRVIAMAADETSIPGDEIRIEHLQHRAEEAGVTRTGLGVVFLRLQERGYLNIGSYTGQYESERYVSLTESCWQWISDNPHLFELQRPSLKEP